MHMIVRLWQELYACTCEPVCQTRFEGVVQGTQGTLQEGPRSSVGVLGKIVKLQCIWFAYAGDITFAAIGRPFCGQDEAYNDDNIL